MTLPEVHTRKDLTQLALDINTAHDRCSESLTQGLAHAVQAGRLLEDAKQQVGHGNWLRWVEENLTFSRWTARNYMTVSRELPELVANGERVPHLSYRKALKLLGKGDEDENVHFSSDSPEWYTPGEVIERAVRTLDGIDLDPCSNSHDNPNVPAAEHYTQDDDGLSREWHGTVYMNPPYGRAIGDWTQRLAASYAADTVKAAVALVPARVDTEWHYLLRSFPRCFIRGRLKFSGHENSAPFPSMVVYLGPEFERFGQAFDDMGPIYAGAVRG